MVNIRCLVKDGFEKMAPGFVFLLAYLHAVHFSALHLLCGAQYPILCTDFLHVPELVLLGFSWLLANRR